MAISQRRYVEITSAVIGATAVPMQKLDGRVFTDNEMIPVGKVIVFYDASEVRGFFGPGAEADFASAYFAYTSPAPVGRAKELQFAAYATEARLPRIVGSYDLDTIGDIVDLGATPIFAIEVDDAEGMPVLHEFSVDVSGVDSYSSVATAINEAAGNDLVGITVAHGILNDGRGAFTVNGSTQGEVFRIVDSDLSIALGLDSQSLFDQGSLAMTNADAYFVASEISDSFGSCHFLVNGDLGDMVEVAELNAAANVKHQLYINVTPADYASYSAALIGTASVGLILRTPNNWRTAHIPMAIMAATDYDRTNATVNYMYRQPGVTLAAQVTTSPDADKYDIARVNYYGQTAVAGSNIEFFQRAFLCGPPSAPLDMSVHANEQWLKAYIAQQWFTLQLSTRGIPANLDGRAKALMVIADTVTKALNNGTILPGKTLTVAQKIAVSDGSGDDKAWHDVQDKGYWYDAEIVENTGPSGLPEDVMKYTLIYGKGDWVRKVEGSHNLV